MVWAPCSHQQLSLCQRTVHLELAVTRSLRKFKHVFDLG